MIIRELVPGDLDEINSWYLKRNMPALTRGVIPKVGFVVPGIAAVFIYQTDSELAIIDGLVTNPEVHRWESGKAALRLMIKATLVAKELRPIVLALTKCRGVERVAKKTLRYKSVGKYEMLRR